MNNAFFPFLSSHSPRRTQATINNWSRGILRHLCRRVFGLVILSLGALGDTVQAGLMLSAAAEPARRAQGASYAFENGGNELYLLNNGEFFGGGSYLGDGKVAFTVHQTARGGLFSLELAWTTKIAQGVYSR